MAIRVNEERLISCMKDLLCCPKTWQYSSGHGYVRTFKVTADSFRVQKAIFDWLNVAERRNAFEYGVSKGIEHKDAYQWVDTEDV